jgi:TM2 domain-containing membrane protein YozV
MTGSDSFAGRIPGLNDVVALNSSRISVEGGSALIVPEGTVAGCATLRLNDIPVDSSVHLRVAGGTLACREGVSIGTRGPALMTLTGGTLAAPWLTAGDEAGGLGVISNEHATIRVDRHLVLGWQVGSKGTLVLKEGKTRVGDQLIVGLYGSGILEAESSFTAGRFIVGCMSKGKGTARIGIGATGTVHTVCFIGGRDYSPDDLGMGTLVLRGGTLMFAKGAWENALQIRYRTEGHGELRGWGSVLEPYTGANRIRNSGR